jgi:hypothetical protein
MMNLPIQPEGGSDLGNRIAKLSAVVRQLSEDAAWLRQEAKRLRTEHAKLHLGARMPLWFLLQLQHAELPVRVVEPEDIRYVSVLTATGLLESEIDALEATARYAASRAATVKRITEHGHAEIARIEDIIPTPAASSMLPERALQRI